MEAGVPCVFSGVRLIEWFSIGLKGQHAQQQGRETGQLAEDGQGENGDQHEGRNQTVVLIGVAKRLPAECSQPTLVQPEGDSLVGFQLALRAAELLWQRP